MDPPESRPLGALDFGSNNPPNLDPETPEAEGDVIIKSQEAIDIEIMTVFSSKDQHLKTQLAKLAAHRRKRQTDRELAIDYELAVRIHDEYS